MGPTEIVMSSVRQSVRPSVCDLFLGRSQIFNIGHDYTLWIRNFMVMMKKPENLELRLGPMAHGQNPAKVPKFKYKA
jgi:hypothetical protein